MSEKNGEIIVRVADLQDYGQISQLMTRYELDCQPYEQWQHLWSNNPVIKELEPDWPIGWVLEWVDEKKVVGFLANIPLEYKFNQKRYVAATASSWVVDKPFRKQNRWLSEAYFGQTRPQLFLNTTAIFATGKIFCNFGGSQIPTPEYDIALFWITNPFGFANSLLQMKAPRFAALAKIPLGLALSAAAMWKKLLRVKKKISIEQFDSFDERFDEFWRELQCTSNLLIARRDRSVLNWHFKFALEQKKLWIFAELENEKIKSYALFYRQDTEAYQLTRIRLVDYQSIDGSSDSLGAMLVMALEKCEEEKISMLEAVGFSAPKRVQMKKLRPFTRKLPAWMFYYKAVAPELSKPLENSASWEPNSFDGDGSL